MIVFPPNPLAGQTFQRWVFDGVKWAPLAIQITETPTAPASGFLVLDTPNTSTTLKFIPFNGDVIRIDGRLYQIPSAGISQGTVGAYVDGVAGQTLVANTTYFVYLFSNAGTLTMDFWNSATIGGVHQNSGSPGNIGTVIRQGDNSRTLIGLIHTSSTNLFADEDSRRYVRSWFNRRSQGVTTGYAEYMSHNTGIGVYAASSCVIYFVAFVDEAMLFGPSIYIWPSAAAVNPYYSVRILIDTMHFIGIQSALTPNAASAITVTPNAITSQYSGLHLAQIYYFATGLAAATTTPAGISGVIL